MNNQACTKDFVPAPRSTLFYLLTCSENHLTSSAIASPPAPQETVEVPVPMTEEQLSAFGVRWWAETPKGSKTETSGRTEMATRCFGSRCEQGVLLLCWRSGPSAGRP